jgi:putative MATE family efflux protein
MKLQADQNREFDRTIVEGPVIRAVWKIAWPAMLQNVLAGLQGFVDNALVGHYVGYHGNAAIGVSWQIFLVILVFLSSVFTGMGVMVARFVGANDPEKVNRVVHQAFLVSLVLSCLVLAPLGYLAAPFLLSFVNATEEVQRLALPYLRIMLVGNVGAVLFFMMGGALRSAGDARTSLRLGLMMMVLNIIFTVILVAGFGPVPSLGTSGAAIGTVLAELVAAGVGFYLLSSGRLVIRWESRRGWKPDMEIIGSLFRFGLPSGLQAVAMNIAGVLLVRFVGSLPQSAEAQAAYTVAYSQLFSLVTWTSVGLMGATAAVVGQNLGAGKPERSILAVRSASRLGLTVAAIIGLVFAVFPRDLLTAFGIGDPIVMDLGVNLLRFLAVSGVFVSTALVFTGGLQGTGDTRSPLYISIVAQMVVPLGICLFATEFLGLEPLHVWLAIVIGHMTRAGLSYVRFRQGAWRSIRID